MRFRIAIAVALFACGPGVHELSLTAPPLVTVHGHTSITSAHPLRAAILWAGVQKLDAFCIKNKLSAAPNATVTEHCADPEWIQPSDISDSVPVAADGTFAIPMDHLPSARVSVGTDAARVAYASVIVAEDINHDGVLDHTNAAPRGFGRGGGGGGGGGPDGPGGQVKPPPDKMRGASFYSLNAEQRRLAFLEGTFESSILNTFYPIDGCSNGLDFPQGFSVLHLPAFFNNTFPCNTEKTSAPIEVPPIPDDQLPALTCSSRGSSVSPPPDQSPLASKDWDQHACVDIAYGNLLGAPQSLVFWSSTDRCPRMVVLQLVGCRNDDPVCKTPEWDLRNAPPAWWPCH